MPNYRRKYLTRVSHRYLRIPQQALLVPVTWRSLEKIFHEKKKNEYNICQINICPNIHSKYTSLRCESTRNNEVDRSISRFDKLPTHGEF